MNDLSCIKFALWQVVMLILHNPETKETLVQTAQVSRVAVSGGVDSKGERWKVSTVERWVGGWNTKD